MLEWNKNIQNFTDMINKDDEDILSIMLSASKILIIMEETDDSNHKTSRRLVSVGCDTILLQILYGSHVHILYKNYQYRYALILNVSYHTQHLLLYIHFFNLMKYN